MSLESEIETRSKQIRTDGYAMSIGEMTSMYRDGDLDIHPEFQRVFRWESKQKSRLIESILLGIPVPPIFVSQREDGTWDVIDGVQRLSTILEFLGLYRDADGAQVSASVLESTEYLPALEGYVWDRDFLDLPDASRAFSDALQRDFKRSRLDFRIIQKESDDNAKYDLFQRLNAGSQLSLQEVRNCLLIMLKSSMYETVLSLSENEHFLSCVPLSEAKQDQAYRQELVLRFFMQIDYSGTGQELGQEHGEYITDWMRTAASRFETPDSPVQRDLFERTFKLLDAATGEDTFKRWVAPKNRHMGAFSISSYEFVTTGVAYHIADWESRGPDDLTARIRGSWDHAPFRTNLGAGISTRRRVPKLVLAGREYFRP